VNCWKFYGKDFFDQYEIITLFIFKMEQSAPNKIFRQHLTPQAILLFADAVAKGLTFNFRLQRQGKKPKQKWKFQPLLGESVTSCGETAVHNIAYSFKTHCSDTSRHKDFALRISFFCLWCTALKVSHLSAS